MATIFYKKFSRMYYAIQNIYDLIYQIFLLQSIGTEC